MVSIIVPVYNAENYLRDSIDSIINQTYSDLEILLVDDGSKDDSGKICDRYAEIDNRIKVFHRPNSGVSKTRNFGLDHSNGDYIIFVDSDDTICMDYVESLLKNNSYDLCVGGYNIFGIKNKTVKPFKRYQIFLHGNISKIDVEPNVPEINIVYHICGKLYKNSIIKKNNIRFPEQLILAEDCYFNLKYLEYCNVIDMIPYAGYNYRKMNRVTPYRFDLKMYSLHVNMITSIFNNLGFNFHYVFKALPKNLILSFFTALKTGLNNLDYKGLCEQSHYNREMKVISPESLFFLGVEKYIYVIIYKWPSAGYGILSLHRLVRKVQR